MQQAVSWILFRLSYGPRLGIGYSIVGLHIADCGVGRASCQSHQECEFYSSTTNACSTDFFLALLADLWHYDESTRLSLVLCPRYDAYKSPLAMFLRGLEYIKTHKIYTSMES